ncbi:MAG: hypothetical protein ACFCU7_09655 [Pleurocapsa sp.]
MKSQADEIKQIATQLLAGMLANPSLERVYPTASGKLSPGQQQELIETAIAMAETLISQVETHIESHFQHNLSQR